MRFVVATILLLAAATGGCARSDSSQGDDTVQRTDHHRMQLRDGSWLLVNSPFPFDEGRAETLAVRVHLYPREVDEEKRTDQCIWIAEKVSSVEYLPGEVQYYALAREDDDKLLLFFTWNGQHCTIDKQTGRIVNQATGDDVLKTWGSVIPIKLVILRRGVAFGPAASANDDELFGPAN